MSTFFKKRIFFLIFVSLVYSLHFSHSIRWLAIGKDSKMKVVRRGVRTPSKPQHTKLQNINLPNTNIQNNLPLHPNLPTDQSTSLHQKNIWNDRKKVLNFRQSKMRHRQTRGNELSNKTTRKQKRQQEDTSNNMDKNSAKPKHKLIPKNKNLYPNIKTKKMRANSHFNHSVGKRRPIRSLVGLVWNTTLCRSRRLVLGLSPKQRRACSRNLDLMPGVVMSARQTLETCQKLFERSRWNCQSINKAPKFLPDLTSGSREQAFVYSLASSSLAHGIAKTCSSGQSLKCGCAQKPHEDLSKNFQWAGCGDDVKFGVLFAKSFVEQGEVNKKRRDVNLHNAAVGRKTVLENVETKCKCHGVSGSCSMKTCFKSLPPIDVIARNLKKRYIGAVGVSSQDETSDPFLLSNPKKSGRSLSKRLVHNDRLIFSSISPDYCLPDSSLGSLGTSGRECQKKSKDSFGCKSMCCGRGYLEDTVEEVFKCQCTYRWCCEVECKMCKKKSKVYKCR